jgi:hypothetical protein
VFIIANRYFSNLRPPLYSLSAAIYCMSDWEWYSLCRSRLVLCWWSVWHWLVKGCNCMPILSTISDRKEIRG